MRNLTENSSIDLDKTKLLEPNPFNWKGLIYYAFLIWNYIKVYSIHYLTFFKALYGTSTFTRKKVEDDTIDNNIIINADGKIIITVSFKFS